MIPTAELLFFRCSLLYPTWPTNCLLLVVVSSVGIVIDRTDGLLLVLPKKPKSFTSLILDNNVRGFVMDYRGYLWFIDYISNMSV